MRPLIRRVLALVVAWCWVAGVPGVPGVIVARSQDPHARGEEVIDRMLAVVAGDLIMMSDVSAAVELGLVPQTSGPDVTRTVLSQLIDRSLMLAEVERYAPPEPNKDAVDREYAAVRDRFSSAQGFEEALVRYGIEEASLRATLRANLRLRAYLAQRFSTVPPLDEEVAAYYRTHLDRFSRGGQPRPLEEVRPDVVQALELDRRQQMVDEWLAGLRRRVTIRDVYVPAVR
jgi:hypothetical protein